MSLATLYTGCGILSMMMTINRAFSRDVTRTKLKKTAAILVYSIDFWRSWLASVWSHGHTIWKNLYVRAQLRLVLRIPFVNPYNIRKIPCHSAT